MHPGEPVVTERGSDKRGLAARPATALATPTLAAPEGIVASDQARQRLAVIALTHDLHQLVLDQPGGFVRQLSNLNKQVWLDHECYRPMQCI